MARFPSFVLLGIAIILNPNPGLSIKADHAEALSAWTEWGPPGGDIRRLELSAAYDDEMLALTAGPPGELYKSGDAGKSWLRIALFHDTLVDFARDARNSYVLGKNRFYKSSNAGATFSPVATPTGLSMKNGGRLAVSPADSAVFLAATLRIDASRQCLAILKSKDGGSAWTTVKIDENAEESHVRDLVISGRNPKTIYSAGYVIFSGDEDRHNRVLKSENGGVTWNQVSVPLFSDYETFSTSPTAIAIDPQDPIRVFIAHEKGVVRSADGGKSWSVHQAPRAFNAGSIAVDPSDGKALFAQSANIRDDRGCYRSADGGITWTKSPNGVYGAGRCIVIRGTRVFLGSSAGILRSVNGGRLYKPSHTGIQASRITALAASPSAPSAIYAGVGDYSLFSMSTLPGAAWVQSADFYRCEGVLSIAVSRSDPNKLFVLAGG